MKDFFISHGFRRDAVPSSFFVYTSNVDGLFGKSGFCESEVAEIHGNANRLQCRGGADCEDSGVWELNDESCSEDLPRCGRCGRICRPNVLMFDDDKWVSGEGLCVYDCWELGMEAYMKEHSDASLVIVELGCGDRVC